MLGAGLEASRGGEEFNADAGPIMPAPAVGRGQCALSVRHAHFKVRVAGFEGFTYLALRRVCSTSAIMGMREVAKIAMAAPR